MEDYNLGLMLGSLFLVIFLILAMAWLAKKFKLSTTLKNNKNFKLIEQLSLGSKQKIIIVEVDSERLVLGVTEQNISLLNKKEITVNDQNQG